MSLQTLRNHRLMPRAEPTRGLRAWRHLTSHLLEFIRSVKMTVLLYSAISVRTATKDLGKLKDTVLRTYCAPSTATTMLSMQTALGLQAQTATYGAKPSECMHRQGLRKYSASGLRLSICDLCGQRWVETKAGLVQATPKAAPAAKTPLDLPDKIKNELLKGRKAATGDSSSHSSAPSAALSSATPKASAAASGVFEPTLRPGVRPRRPTGPPPAPRRMATSVPIHSDTDMGSVPSDDQSLWTRVPQPEEEEEED